MNSLQSMPSIQASLDLKNRDLESFSGTTMQTLNPHSQHKPRYINSSLRMPIEADGRELCSCHRAVSR